MVLPNYLPMTTVIDYTQLFMSPMMMVRFTPNEKIVTEAEKTGDFSKVLYVMGKLDYLRLHPIQGMRENFEDFLIGLVHEKLRITMPLCTTEMQKVTISVMVDFISQQRSLKVCWLL